LLAGCAGGPPPASLTAEQAHAAETEKLCWGYGEFGRIIGGVNAEQTAIPGGLVGALNRPGQEETKGSARTSRQNIRDEITQRGAVTTEEWSLVDGTKIANGEGRCAVLATFGKPSVVNETASGIGIEVLAFGSSVFITLRNGTVTGYQAPGDFAAPPITPTTAIANPPPSFSIGAPVVLGVQGTTVPASIASQLHLDGGLLVATVTPNSPAARAGIIAGDVITSYNGTPVRTEADLRNMLKAASRGGAAALVLKRGDQEIRTTATF